MPDPLLIAAVVFGLVLLSGFAAGLAGNSRSAIHRRALALKGNKPRRKRSGDAGVVSVKRREARGLPVFEAIADRFLPRQSVLRDRLARAGLQLTIGGYLVTCLFVAGVAIAVAIFMVGLPPMAAAPAGIAIGAALPHLFVGFLGGRRRTRFLNVLPDAIDLIVRGIKSGLPITESIAIVGRELPDPVGCEFRQVSDGVRFGRRLDEVMWETATRLESAEFNFLVITLSIQQETGGNLAETLANLGDILRRRKQMRLKIKALSSEAKASAFILGSLPIAMFCFLYTMNPDYESVLLSDPRGQLMLGCATASLLLCIVVMAKMIRFEI